MRILVVGGTGGTGLHLIRTALERDLDVTAAVRSPAKLGELAGHVQAITADVFDGNEIRRAALGVDAALSCIGAPAGFLGRGATTVYSRAATTLVEALPQAEVRRLIFCTSAGVEPHDPAEPIPYRLIAKPLFLQRAYDDMTLAEHVVRRSKLAWTLVRPARLTDAPPTGRISVSPRFRTPGGKGISRADVAAFMLDQLTDPTWIGATPTLTRPRTSR